MFSEKEIKEELEFQERIYESQQEDGCLERDIFYTLGQIKALKRILGEKMLLSKFIEEM